MPASPSNLGLSGQLRATVGVERRRTILLHILLGLGSVEHVVRRDVDNPCSGFLGGLGDVPRSERVNRAQQSLGSRSHASTSVKAARWTMTSTPRATSWTAVGTVTSSSLCGRNRAEGSSLRRAWPTCPPAPVTRTAGSVPTGAPDSHHHAPRGSAHSIPHGIASEGSFQAMPNSSAPSYSSLDEVDQVDIREREEAMRDAGRDLQHGRLVGVQLDHFGLAGARPSFEGPRERPAPHPGRQVPPVDLPPMIVKATEDVANRIRVIRLYESNR